MKKQTPTTTTTTRSKRGFAAMSPEQAHAIRSKGGITAHTKGTAHQWDSTTAREAGRKGGLATKKPVTPE